MFCDYFILRLENMFNKNINLYNLTLLNVKFFILFKNYSTVLILRLSKNIRRMPSVKNSNVNKLNILYVIIKKI